MAARDGVPAAPELSVKSRGWWCVWQRKIGIGGYRRILGALSNLGHTIGRGTVANILKHAGIEPAAGAEPENPYGQNTRPAIGGDAPLPCRFVMRNNTCAPLLAYLTGLVNQRLLLQCEYLIAENRVLRSHVSGRLRLSNAERSTLGEIGKRLGRRCSGESGLCCETGNDPRLVSPSDRPQVRRL